MKRVILMMLTAAMLSGCSVYMAASGEQKRDMNILAPGTHRDIILAEFGSPVSSIDELVAAEVQAQTGDEVVATATPAPSTPPLRRRYDIFKFVQGRSTASNAGRAVFYGAAAVFTLGLSEVVATPLEYAVGDQGEIRLRTNYDDDWNLKSAQVYDEGDWITIAEYNERVLQREAELDEKSAVPNS